jgi:hypothetical protein
MRGSSVGRLANACAPSDRPLPRSEPWGKPPTGAGHGRSPGASARLGGPARPGLGQVRMSVAEGDEPAVSSVDGPCSGAVIMLTASLASIVAAEPRRLLTRSRHDRMADGDRHSFGHPCDPCHAAFGTPVGPGWTRRHAPWSHFGRTASVVIYHSDKRHVLINRSWSRRGSNLCRPNMAGRSAGYA